MDVAEQFEGSERRYEFLDNQSKLIASSSEYRDKRISVATEVLFPQVDANRITLRMFKSLDSPKGYVTRLQTPELFEAIVDNDPLSNRSVIMHLRMRTYSNSSQLFGEVEEIMFLDQEAPNAYEPLIAGRIPADSSSVAAEGMESGTRDRTVENLTRQKVNAQDKESLAQNPPVPTKPKQVGRSETHEEILERVAKEIRDGQLKHGGTYPSRKKSDDERIAELTYAERRGLSDSELKDALRELRRRGMFRDTPTFEEFLRTTGFVHAKQYATSDGSFTYQDVIDEWEEVDKRHWKRNLGTISAMKAMMGY